MGNKFIALLLFSLVLLPLAAQNVGGDKTYSYVVIEDGSTKIVQHLFWELVPYVRHYEIILEQQNEEEDFTEILREFTKDTFVNISLGPGYYRYAVLVYDLLNRPHGGIEWEYFEIILALQPEIQNFSPAAFYIDEDTVWGITLNGINLEEGAEVILRQKGERNRDIVPLKTVAGENGRTILVDFDIPQLMTGIFDIHVKNPGGLDAQLGPFRVAFRKVLDINVSAGYGLVFPLYGNIFSFFEQNVFPLGAHTKLSLVPFKRVWGYFGVELEPFWNYMDAQRPNEEYEVISHLVGANLYFLYQLWLPNRTMAFNLRLGAGLTSIVDFHFSYAGGNSESFTAFYFSAGGELSFQWLIRKPFFVEVGAGFNHLFAVKDKIQPAFIRPMIGAGWQF